MLADREAVLTWMADWWYLAGEIMSDLSTAGTDRPQMWDSFVYKAAVIPDEVQGVDIRTLKRFLRGIVAIWDPSPVNGPRLSTERLHELSSEAWATYQRLQQSREGVESPVELIETDSRRYAMKRLEVFIECGNDTVVKYLNAAKLPRAARGQKDFVYTHAQVIKLLKYVVANPSSVQHADAAKSQLKLFRESV